MIGALLLSLSALAVPLDPGRCDEAKLVATRNAVYEATPRERGDILVHGVSASCPEIGDELRLALQFWSGRGNLREASANIDERLCPERKTLINQPLGGSYVERIDSVWRNCGLKQDRLIKKREAYNTAGPVAATLGSRLYERWTARGIDKDVAADLGRAFAGLIPLDRGLYADVASEAVGASLPQSGGDGPAADTACAPLIVLDVGAIRLDGQGLLVGTPEEREEEVLRALPGLETALAEWTPPETCAPTTHAIIAPDAKVLYPRLLEVAETVQLAGRQPRLLLAVAPDISLSGDPRTRWDGLLIKSWAIDVGSSPDIKLGERIQPPPVARIGVGTVDLAATGVQPARRDCADGTRATVCADSEPHDPGQYDWATLFRAVGDIRTSRGVGAIDSVVVVPTGDFTIGVMVKVLDAWAWGLREGTGAIMPPPFVLTDPDRQAVDGDVGAELETAELPPPPPLPIPLPPPVEPAEAPESLGGEDHAGGEPEGEDGDGPDASKGE